MLDAVIDISHFNGSPDWKQVRAAGIVGVIHKATQGGTWVDPSFAAARAAVSEAGLLWGAYHFATGAVDGATQARFFLDTVRPDAQTLCVIDFESNPSGQPMPLDELLAWVETVQTATGRPPVVYGGRSLLFPAVGTAPQPTLAACPLWVAEYTAATDPSGIPGQVWKTWTLWQYTETGNVAGVSGYVDRSRFQGSAEELATWWTESGAAALPPA